PKSCEKPVDRNQANQSCKPAVSYEWDFHPRLIPLGIWDDTYLEVRGQQHVRSAEVRYKLSDNFSSAEVFAEVEVDGVAGGSNARVHWQLFNRNGACVIAQSAQAATKVKLTA